MHVRHRRRQLSYAEFKKLANLSLPLILAQLAQSSMGFVDTAMSGRVSAQDLAAVAVGSSIWFPMMLLLLGILSALTPTISQAYGAGDTQAIKHITPQGVYLGALLGVVVCLFLHQAHHLLPWLKVSPQITPIIMGYLKGISWGFPALGACFALRYCSEGLSLTRPSMFVSFFGLAVNIVMNYVLIFGKLGLPAMGGVGCGPASAITMWAMFLGMLFVFWRTALYRQLQMLRLNAAWCAKTQRQLVKLGLPIGGGLFIECSIFAIIALLLAQFGAQAVAAHQIALSFTSMTFMIPLSIATAISVRVGHTIGQKRPQQTRRAIVTGLFTTLGCALVSCTMMAVFPHLCVSIFSNDPELLTAAASLLFLAAIFQIPDAIQVCCAGALRGFKDTKVPMIIQTFSYWGVGLPIGCYLGLYLNWGAKGFWVGLICGLTSAAIMLSFRLYHMFKRTTHH